MTYFVLVPEMMPREINPSLLNSTSRCWVHLFYLMDEKFIGTIESKWLDLPSAIEIHSGISESFEDLEFRFLIDSKQLSAPIGLDTIFRTDRYFDDYSARSFVLFAHRKGEGKSLLCFSSFLSFFMLLPFPPFHRYNFLLF